MANCSRLVCALLIPKLYVEICQNLNLHFENILKNREVRKEWMKKSRGGWETKKNSKQFRDCEETHANPNWHWKFFEGNTKWSLNESNISLFIFVWLENSVWLFFNSSLFEFRKEEKNFFRKAKVEKLLSQSLMRNGDQFFFFLLYFWTKRKIGNNCRNSLINIDFRQTFAKRFEAKPSALYPSQFPKSNPPALQTPSTPSIPLDLPSLNVTLQ